jgi:hypothetical protein
MKNKSRSKSKKHRSLRKKSGGADADSNLPSTPVAPAPSTPVAPAPASLFAPPPVPDNNTLTQLPGKPPAPQPAPQPVPMPGTAPEPKNEGFIASLFSSKDPSNPDGGGVFDRIKELFVGGKRTKKRRNHKKK